MHDYDFCFAVLIFTSFKMYLTNPLFFFKRLISYRVLTHVTFTSTSKPCQCLFDSCSYCSRQHDEQRAWSETTGVGSTALWSPLIELICARQQRHTAGGTCLVIRAVQSLIFLSKSVWRHGSNTVWGEKDEKLKQSLIWFFWTSIKCFASFVYLCTCGCNAAPAECHGWRDSSHKVHQQEGNSWRNIFFPIAQT